MASSTSTRRVVLLCCGSFNPITNMHLRMFEIARDYLHRTGKYQVLGGIISPVNDAYGKKDLIESKHRLEMCRLALQTSDWITVDSWECEQNQWHPTMKVLTHHQKAALANYNACKGVQVRGVKRRRQDNDQCTGSQDINYGENNARTSQRLRGRYKPIQLTNMPTLTKTKRCVHSQDVETTQDQSDSDLQVKLLCGADLLESFAVPGLWADQDVEDIVSKHGIVVITREGSNPQKFVYESDVLYRNSKNIQIVTEWIYNEISSTRIRRALSRNESIRYLVPESVIQYIKTNELYQKDSNKNKSQIFFCFSELLGCCCLCITILPVYKLWHGFVK
ncbi:nicotinamide/nicotinic acid mononucleotide adenylyltransferase 3-like isoform X2 [Anneissia japonica]|uniref:nicotinamide/nicotinic acid mononucleotide adenylyltransferase 3-like isoform X2 n=1 Tax=Anneissia japonica TaxID=1529436 RepID=UPI001425745D|nr:nicotinamide/nicotinic acid mononucleotide adenylyltransferase 3-like isoform X2 [Anneissia japonica]